MSATAFPITLTATNATGQVLAAFSITVEIARPLYLGTLADQSTTEGAAFSYDVSRHFSGKSLTFAATGLPAGLAVDGATGVISGTAGA